MACARSISPIRRDARECYMRALVVLEREPETRLDLSSSLDETERRRLRGPYLGVPNSCDRHCEQGGVTYLFSPLQRGPCVD